MLNEMNKIYLKVAECGSISKASEHLYISQPALSNKLKNLEDKLGEQLLIRSNNGVELTDVGKIVQKYFVMQEIMEFDMKKEIEDYKNKIINVKILATSTVCNY